MDRIKNYQDFKSDRSKAKPQEQEKPHQKSDTDDKPHRKSDNTPPQKPAATVTIPGWKTY